MPSSNFTIIELSGHIIDSLTLAKVIDKIQAAGCEYQINDLQIGQKKNDISTAQISVWTEDQPLLTTLLEELKPYGVKTLMDHAVDLEPCPKDGVVPENAYIRLNPPTEILYQDQWLPVERQGIDLVIVLDPKTKSAHLQKTKEVKQGNLVVVGDNGIKILPTLGENVHAQPVAR